MRFCTPHWRELREAITSRGLGGFIARGGAEAARRLEALPDGGREGFDPLMGGLLAIVQNAIGVVGQEALAANPDGSERCVLCFLVGVCPCGMGDACSFRGWIALAADGQLSRARALGLAGAA
jgi:hypothetical protein